MLIGVSARVDKLWNAAALGMTVRRVGQISSRLRAVRDRRASTAAIVRAVQLESLGRVDVAGGGVSAA